MEKQKLPKMKLSAITFLIVSCLLFVFIAIMTIFLRQESNDVIKSISLILKPKKNSEVTGSLDLTESKNGVNIFVKLQGLKPKSTHGFHIHENGDCSSADGKSAGGHYSPQGNFHGGPDKKGSHEGDLGNLIADSDGSIEEALFVRHVSLSEFGQNSILDRAFVLHTGRDDLKSQPSGNSGERIACVMIN